MKFSVTNREQLVKIQFILQFILFSFFFCQYNPQAKSLLTTISPQKKNIPADSPCPAATHIATCCVLGKTLKFWLQSLLSLHYNDINSKQELKAGLLLRSHERIGLSKVWKALERCWNFWSSRNLILQEYLASHKGTTENKTSLNIPQKVCLIKKTPGYG